MLIATRKQRTSHQIKAPSPPKGQSKLEEQADRRRKRDRLRKFVFK